MEIIPQSEIYRDGQLPLEPPQSLLRAMMVFFIGVAAGRLEAIQTHRSMLIHPSKATATHRQYLDWANGLMAHWHSVLLAAGEPDRQELLAEFREAHAGLARTCDTLPPFEQIQTRLPVAINQTAVTLVNSVDGREVPWPNSPSHILVGGEKLRRGYTADIPHCPFHFCEYSAIQSLIWFPKQPEQRLVLLGEIDHQGRPLPRDEEHMNPDKILEDPSCRRVLHGFALLVGKRRVMLLQGGTDSVF